MPHQAHTPIGAFGVSPQQLIHGSVDPTSGSVYELPPVHNFNYPSFRGLGDFGASAPDWTVKDLWDEVNRAQSGGPLTRIPAVNPPSMTSGASNLIGANLKIAYWYAIAARYMEGNQVGAGWGPDASTKAKNWSNYYAGVALKDLSARSLSMTARIGGIGVGTESQVKAAFAKAARWLEGYASKDPKGGLVGIGAILRSIGAQTATAFRREQTGGRGTTIAPDPGWLPKLPSIPWWAIVGGTAIVVYTATRK